MGRAHEIAEMLLKLGAVKVSMAPLFEWASGIKSPVYCDNRKLISHPKERRRVVEGFKDMLNSAEIKPEYIGGTATAAIPCSAKMTTATISNKHPSRKERRAKS